MAPVTDSPPDRPERVVADVVVETRPAPEPPLAGGKLLRFYDRMRGQLLEASHCGDDEIRFRCPIAAVAKTNAL